MGETFPGSDPELEREAGLQRLVEQYLPGDVEFMKDMDEEEKLSYIYGQLFEMGEDPDNVLQEFGVTEPTMSVVEVRSGYVKGEIELGGATDEV